MKTETKHTPGPWSVKIGDMSRREMSTIHKACDPEWWIGHVITEDRNEHQRAEDIANARLIAAAPDLLESLQLLLTFEPLIAEHRPAATYTIERAKAAIRKATGGDA